MVERHASAFTMRVQSHGAALGTDRWRGFGAGETERRELPSSAGVSRPILWVYKRRFLAHRRSSTKAVGTVAFDVGVAQGGEPCSASGAVSTLGRTERALLPTRRTDNYPS